VTLEQLFAGRNFDVSAAQQRMARLMHEEGLPYGSRTMTFNSRLAQEIAAWAVTQPGGEQIHDALFRAYFVDGRNISQLDVLQDVAEAIGLDRASAKDVVETRSYRDAVDADWNESRRLGVTGVPTFVAGDRGVSGAQSYEILEQLVATAGD
jgi:predicted DsbA family dithiol-disulfide isomerase